MSASWISRVRFEVITTIGGCAALHGAELRDGHLEIRQHLEQESLERFVGAVELVDQQHRRARRIRLERLQQRPLDQEALGEHVVLEPLAVVSRLRPRRRGSRSSARHSSIHRPPPRRRAPRSIAAGSAGARASTRAPWRSRSCRPRPRPRGTAGGPSAARETARSRASGRRDSPPRQQVERRIDRGGQRRGAGVWFMEPSLYPGIDGLVLPRTQTWSACRRCGSVGAGRGATVASDDAMPA